MRRWIADNAQQLEVAAEASAIALAVLVVGVLAQRQTLPATIAAGALTTLTLLGVAHVVLWPWRDKMPRPASYVVGVSCIGAGLLLVSALSGLWIVLIAFVGVTLPGGLLIIAAWWLRSALKLPADTLSSRAEATHAVRRERDHRSN